MPSLPHAGAHGRRRDQQTTESDGGMASENAGDGYGSDNKNPYDARHSVYSFLLERGWNGRLCVCAAIARPDMIVLEATDGSDADG